VRTMEDKRVGEGEAEEKGAGEEKGKLSEAEGSRFDELIKRLERLEEKIDRDLKEGRIKGKEQSVETERQSVEAEGHSVVGEVVGQFIPGLGGIIKALERSSPEFRKRIAETDEEIKHRIDVGWSSKPVIDYSISTRTLKGGNARRPRPRTPEIKVPVKGAEREPIVDLLVEKDHLQVIAELPGVEEKDLEVALEGDTLEIKAGEFIKRIELPATGTIEKRTIKERTFKNGILHISIAP